MADEAVANPDDPFAASRARLDGMADLEDTWFDEVSKRPSDAAIDKGREVLEALEESKLPAPKVFPTPEGGISLEWTHQPMRVGVVILPSGSSGEYSYWNEETDQDGFEGDKHVSPSQVVEYIRAHVIECPNG